MRISDWSSDGCSSDLAAATLREEGSTIQPLECQRRISDLIACHVHGIESDSSANAPGNGDLRSHGSGPEPFGADRLATVPSLSWMAPLDLPVTGKSEEHTSELQSLMRISYAVFCLKKKKKQKQI